MKRHVFSAFTDGKGEGHNPGFSIQKRFIVYKAAGKVGTDGKLCPGIHQLLWALEVCKLYANRGRGCRTAVYRPEPIGNARQPKWALRGGVGGEREK